MKARMTPRDHLLILDDGNLVIPFDAIVYLQLVRP